jgi:ADP-ribose pyrophosphatase
VGPLRERSYKRFAIESDGMEKPAWRLRASRYVVDSPYMRLRSDEVELPNGMIVPDYYVRESRGFVVVVALTPDERVVLVRQYRYGSDSIHLEVPAGMLLDDEEPESCARRELAEETGYEVESCELVADYFPEPVRSNARAYIYIGRGARRVRPPPPPPPPPH